MTLRPELAATAPLPGRARGAGYALQMSNTDRPIRHRPLFACTACHRPEGISPPANCTRRGCKGTIRSACSADGWTMCDECAGTGVDCSWCDGFGWTRYRAPQHRLRHRASTAAESASNQRLRAR
jgi:hypothetical protein